MKQLRINGEEYLTIGTLARLSGLYPNTVIAYALAHKYTFQEIGKRRYYKASMLDELKERHGATKRRTRQAKAPSEAFDFEDVIK